MDRDKKFSSEFRRLVDTVRDALKDEQNLS